MVGLVSSILTRGPCVVEIETFLKNDRGEFVSVSDYQGPVPDADYIEGAVKIVIDGREILGVKEWDYVDQLWSYLARMVADLRSEGDARTRFPDQPIELSLQRNRGRVLVTVDSRVEVQRADVSFDDFLAAVISSGLLFFERMSEIAPGNSYESARKDLLG